MSVIFIDSTQIEYNGTENEARFRLAVDTAADLSGLTHYDSIKISGGSDALDISTGDTYIINSVGVWVRQPSANAWNNVYTKAETDALLLPLQNGLQVTGDLIDTGSKNRMKLTGSNVTGYGIACTFDVAAGTIHLDGINPDKTCTGSFNIQAADSRALGLIEGTTYRFTCDGYATDNNTIGIYVYTSGATPLYQFDCFTNTVAAWESAWEQASGFRLFIRQGTVVDDVTLRPMICTERDYQISPDFVPYCPTLAELYALVRSYHP